MRVKTLTSPLEGSTKNLLQLQNWMGGKNSPPKLNIQVMIQNLLKVLTTAKTMP